MFLKVLNIYLIRYNFFIAFCAISSLFYFSILTEQEISSFYYLFTFFGTLTLYNLFRLSPSFTTILKKQTFGFSNELIFVSLVICAFSFFFIPSKTKYYYLIPLLLSFLYQFSILGSKNIRTLPYFKILVTALVWVLMTGIPFVTCDFSDEKRFDFYLLVISQLLFFLSLAIPFDVFDEEKDAINTLAKILGSKKAIFLALFFLLGYLVLHLLGKSSFQLKLAHGLITFFGFFSLILYKKWNTISLQYYFIDGLIILQAGIIFLLHNLDLYGKK